MPTSAGDKRFRKAHRLTADDIAALQAAGVAEVVAAVLDAGRPRRGRRRDAASPRALQHRRHRGRSRRRPAGSICMPTSAGVFTVDTALIDAINAVDPAITIATLAEHAAVEAGQMVATVKIIPFAVAGSAGRCGRRDSAQAARSSPSMPFRPMRVGVDPDRAARRQGQRARQDGRASPKRGWRARAARRPPSGGRRTTRPPSPRRSTSLARDSDMVVIFGASALSDFDDVIPAAIRLAGGDGHARRHAGRSRQSAGARQARRQAGASARRAARAAPRRTASTGCSTG